MVTSVLKRSLADGIAVPTHLQTKTQLFVEQFESLTSQASQRSRVVSHALERWQSFTASMEKSTSQLSDAQSELASLVQVEEFLMELTSLESRLSVSWYFHLLPSSFPFLLPILLKLFLSSSPSPDT